MKEDDPFGYGEGPEFSLKDDFTKWVDVDPKQRAISVAIYLVIDAVRDAALHKFFVDYLGLASLDHDLTLSVKVIQAAEGPQQVCVEASGQRFEDLKAQEVLKRLQTSRTFLFYSATDPQPIYHRGFRGVLRDISEEYTTKIQSSQKTLNNLLKRIARDQQEEIEQLLGRLNQKYKVGLSLPTFDLSYFPYDITLGDRRVDVDLENWGSGTRNRTLILLAIFRAKQVAEFGVSASKVTPIIVVEEPESFLHPLAQAEFGRVLQDLADEFKVQIIVTTHSPYLLSQNRPDANILLERTSVRRQIRHTDRVDTSGDRWMEPFALSLGITDDAFRPWRELFFTPSDAILLVEGETDKEYFELLRDAAHGANQLAFEGEIFAYGGRDTLKNQALLRFIKDRFTRIFVSFDLDSETIVEGTLQALGFEKRKNYMPLGVDECGKRRIEGLLPDDVRSHVYADNPDLVTTT